MAVAAEMISNLLHNLNPSRRGAPTQSTTLDSVTEELHTKQLIFPDPNALSHSETQPYPIHVALPSGSVYDGAQGEIDLEYPRDIRIIIAQDESGTMPKTVLYDSKPGPTRAESPTQTLPRSRGFGGGGNTSTAGPTFGGTHARRSSLAIDPTTPRSPTGGAFQRVRTRGSSISSMPNIDEHTQPRTPKDTVDEVSICLDCMFGNTAMSYRGNTNKLHIVPLESRPPDLSVTSPGIQGLQDATSSLGRAEGLRRRSNLAKSFTPSNLPQEITRPATAIVDTSTKETRRRTIFITRTFSVALPEDDQGSDASNARTPTPQNSLPKTNGFPFPRSAGKASGKGPQPAQTRKTPMYGISIILHLPVASPPRPASRLGLPNLRGSGFMSGSVPGHESLGSSLDSDRRAGWAVIDSSFGVDSLLSTSLNSDVDDRVDVVGQHWDVITRTLTSLQFTVHERILAHFKANEATSPPIIHQPRMQPGRATNRDLPVQPPPRRNLRLQPNALQFDQNIKRTVELAGDRVVRGLKIPRVITGQGRWGVWREEARWLGRWAGGRDENFFFFNLLTAFLGSHTEWLNILGPKWYRRRHRENQRTSAGEDLTLANRTIIVSPNKMAARRLIFLLAAFLPSSTPTMYDGASPMRPSTSASFRAYSQSPPSNMPVSRKQSLRRTINRRPRPKQSLSDMRPKPSGTNGSNAGVQDTLHENLDRVASNIARPPSHSRRSSAHSIRSSLVLPSMSDSVTTKGSAATTSTVTQESSYPVAHFTVPRNNRPSPEHRPGSSESLASANLMNNLQRSSSGHISSPSSDSQSTGRWGSLMSFWSSGRRSSTDHSDILQTTDDGLGISGAYKHPTERPRTALEQMVAELELNPEQLYAEDIDIDEPATGVDGAEDKQEDRPLGSSGVPASAARAIPERPKSHHSPLKLSVNEKDGVIDVDIPLPEFGSPLQSPLFGGHSVSSFEGSSFSQSSVFSFPPQEPDQPVNVAGWLKEFHPDFALQAIKPYENLERDVKRAMSAEPTPMTSTTTPTYEQGPMERWIDITSSLVADTRTFTIKRIRLRRLVRLIPAPQYHQPVLTPGLSGVPGRSQYGNPYTSGAVLPMTELHLEEQFSEEVIMDMDGTLVDAVERILAQSGQSTRVQSASSSRSSSRRGRKDQRGDDGAISVLPGIEIPRSECKTLILDALENVVRSVTAERGVKDEVSKTDAKTPRESKASTPAAEPAKNVANKTSADSTLKEGIRRWLSEVE